VCLHTRVHTHYPNAERQHNQLEIPNFSQSNFKILRFAEITTHHRSGPSEKRPGERRKTPYSLDVNLITTQLSIAANRRLLNWLSYSTSRIGLTTSRCASPCYARDLSSIVSNSLSTFNQDHHCFVAEWCTHFPQLLVLERKKHLKLGLKLGYVLKRIPNKYGHISSGFFSTPSPTSPRYANLTSTKIDLLIDDCFFYL